MGFKTGNLPPVDPATFHERPFFERIQILATQWAEYGFGTPKMVHVIYIVKLLTLYVVGGLFVATATSGLGPFWDVAAWWPELIVYEKLILWTLLLETLGLAGSWGPLVGHFKPMTGGFRYWARPDTIRLPPWPDRVPFTRGDRRTVADVALYLAIVATAVAALVAPTATRNGVDLVNPALLIALIGLLVVMGVRDKVVFLAARSEQYLPALFFFAVLGPVDLIIALKLLIVVVWIGAGVSKFGRHFSLVVPPMVSNTPWAPRALKRINYRSFPDDLRPSHAASLLAHIGGSTVEIVLPLMLLFSRNPTVTLLAVIGMVGFHLFILSTFPLAVPLEWNVLFAFATVFLFWGHPAWDGYSVADISSPALLVAIVAGLLFFPVLGNLRPDLVSFLPSMRQYAGNWASATWAFAPGAEAKLDKIVRGAGNTVDQVAATYRRPVAEMLLTMPMAWRGLHSQGPALLSMMVKHLGDDIDTYSLREAEFGCNTVVGFNFGDGHFHDEQLIEAIQKRCRFEPGEFIVAWVESQPIHKNCQQYKVIDAALGVIERGSYKVADAVDELPWLPYGPIPLHVTWTRPTVDDRVAAVDVSLVGTGAPVMATAVVVGSGPNGLAAAVRLAQHGIDVEVLEAADHIGGGTRSSELTVPGVVHDHCSAFHPMGVGSPYLSTLDLARHGLRWRWPEIDCAHPLDTGEAGLLTRSIDDTAAGLGPDGWRWRQMFAGLTNGFDDLAADLMRPILHVPRHPLRLLRFGPPALLPAALTARVWRTHKARALFGGVAAHAFHPLHRPTTSAIGMTIVAAGHRHGWPVAEGGSQSIANALASLLGDLGGKIHTGVYVRTAGDIPPADVVLLDLAPAPIARILGDRLPSRVARAYRRYRHGPGAFKLDLATDGDVPWTNPACGRAGTVHLGGTFEEVASTERDIASGRMPARPFVLVGQQYLADPTRSAGDINPIWTYAHVPHGYTGDATEAILGQIERFAPDFRDRIIARVARPTTQLPIDNPNYVGGDIITGANTERQVVVRPRVALDPYRTGLPGTFICSAASPPGAGAHGMCGYNAAGSALRHLRITPVTPSRPMRRVS